jgi:hypothetical protein
MSLPFTHPLTGGLRKPCLSRLPAAGRGSLETTALATAPAHRFTVLHLQNLTLQCLTLLGYDAPYSLW